MTDDKQMRQASGLLEQISNKRGLRWTTSAGQCRDQQRHVRQSDRQPPAHRDAGLPAQQKLGAMHTCNAMWDPQLSAD